MPFAACLEAFQESSATYFPIPTNFDRIFWGHFGLFGFFLLFLSLLAIFSYFWPLWTIFGSFEPFWPFLGLFHKLCPK